MRKHGLSTTQFYKKFYHMIRRCRKDERYRNNGIKCEWKTFQSFMEDMYDSYKKHVEKYGKRNTTIDRIDGKKNYNKENCRWATRIVQARNTKKNRKIIYRGKYYVGTELDDMLGHRRGTVLQRITKQKWSVEDAVNLPTPYQRKHAIKKKIINKKG